MDPSKQPPAMGQAGGTNRQGSMGQELDLGFGYRWFCSAHNPFTVYTKMLCDVQSSQIITWRKRKKNQWTVFSIGVCYIWMLLINSGRFWRTFESLWLPLSSLCVCLLKPLLKYQVTRSFSFSDYIPSPVFNRCWSGLIWGLNSYTKKLLLLDKFLI